MKLSVFYLRRMGRALMHGKYTVCLGGMTVLLVFSLAFSTLEQSFLNTNLDLDGKTILTALLIAVLSLAVTSPAQVGVRSLFGDIANQREAKLAHVFQWYGDGKRLNRSIVLMLLQSLLFLAAAVVFFGLVFGGAYAIHPEWFAGLTSNNIFAVADALTTVYTLALVALVPTYLVVVPFLPAPYLLAEDPEKKPLVCLRESRRAIRGFYWKYVGLQLLSFLQVIAYAFLASIVAVLFSGGDITGATTVASWILLLVMYFNILPHLGISTVLFLNDARARESQSSAE